MSEQPSPEARASGVFLLSLAALALFDFWFPGIFFAVGVAAIVWARAVEQRHPARIGWMLLAVGGVFWMRDLFIGWGVPDLFPLAMIALGVMLALGIDWRRWFPNL